MMLPNGREEVDEYFYNIDFADDKHVIFQLETYVSAVSLEKRESYFHRKTHGK